MYETMIAQMMAFLAEGRKAKAEANAIAVKRQDAMAGVPHEVAHLNGWMAGGK
jgi:hypothetical protein